MEPVLNSGPAVRTLLHVFSSFEFGGAQARFVQLANRFGPRFRHLIVAMDGNTQAAARLEPQVRFELLNFINQRGQGLGNRAACKALLQAQQPDLLLTYNWGAIEWASANWPRPLVPHLHVEDGFGPTERQQQLPRRVWMRRLLLGPLGHATVGVPSRRLAECARGWWVPARRLHYIANGVPIPNSAAAATARPQDLTRLPVVGTVAGLRAEKNIGRLIKALAALPPELPARLLVVGDGPERPALEALARHLQVQDRTEFTGYLRHPAEALQRMDLFALPSDTEQQPMAMMEAMAAGLPVCATRVGDVPHIVPPALHGQLCAPEDAAFAACLARTLRQREQWPRWAAAGLEALRAGYSEDRMAAAWQALWDGTGLKPHAGAEGALR